MSRKLLKVPLFGRNLYEGLQVGESGVSPSGASVVFDRLI